MRALVTGATGFLGRRIAEMLRDRGAEVVALTRRDDPELCERGVRLVRGDLADPTSLVRACDAVDVVFHVAAKTGIWGPSAEFWETNVEGTRRVIEACRVMRAPKLVYTSSPSVVFGEDDLCGVDERQSYPKSYLAAYPETKAIAERAVLAANGSGLATVALRPHLIFGPRDPHLIPRVIARARAGKLVQVGDGKNRVDITYIDNAAEAHILAADALVDAGCVCAGKVYFIGQEAPVVLWDWLRDLLEAAGAPPIRRSISYASARRLGRLLETAFCIVRARREPRLTRFLAAQLAKSHYFSHAAAAKEIGYHPRVSLNDAMRRLLEWLKHESLYGSESRLPPLPAVP